MKDATSEKRNYPTIVKVWLCIGLFMLVMQVVIGGITRLTGSGLSITKWEIVTGTLPPLNADAWEHEFDLYKDTPQYQKINEGMSLSEFKFIYFWEYFHRLWARSMGFVFLIPFLIFWRKKYIDPPLMKKLGIVVLLAAVVAVFGWIMVASGLVDRPWVNAYKLTLHLSLALLVFSYLLWTTFFAFGVLNSDNESKSKWRKANIWLLVLVCFQIVLGGLMSGMHAALVYPTWPMMHDSFIPSLLFDSENWKMVHFTDYDKNPFMPALVQVFHRLTGYVVYIFGIWFSFKLFNNAKIQTLKIASLLFLGFLNIQVILGILTLIGSKGMVPVGLGVMHQGVALFVLGSCLFMLYHFRNTGKV
jgi:cytochrome c oxidase assembly protein subunit 15